GAHDLRRYPVSHQAKPQLRPIAGLHALGELPRGRQPDRASQAVGRSAQALQVQAERQGAPALGGPPGELRLPLERQFLRGAGPRYAEMSRRPGIPTAASPTSTRSSRSPTELPSGTRTRSSSSSTASGSTTCTCT